MVEYSIVIPVYNEYENLGPLYENVSQAMALLSEPYEIIFVDDGSRDGSSDLLEKIIEGDMRCRLLIFDKNYGQSSALAAGFKAAEGAVIITLDADLQVDAGDIPLLLKKLERFDLVCGYRRVRADPWLKRLSSRVANTVSKQVIKSKIHDSACPLKVFKKSVIQNMVMFDGMHRFFPALAEFNGHTCTEVQISHSPRIHGESKYNIRNRLLKSFIDLLAVKWLKKRKLKYTISSEK